MDGADMASVSWPARNASSDPRKTMPSALTRTQAEDHVRGAPVDQVGATSVCWEESAKAFPRRPSSEIETTAATRTRGTKTRVVSFTSGVLSMPIGTGRRLRTERVEQRATVSQAVTAYVSIATVPLGLSTVKGWLCGRRSGMRACVQVWRRRGDGRRAAPGDVWLATCQR